MLNTKRLLDRKTVVITGAGGYIGSALTNELKKYSLKIIRISRKKLPPMSGVKDLVLDLTKKNSWKRIVSEADIIFHLAGNTSIYKAQKDPESSQISTLHPINYLIDASKELSRTPRVIFTSTVTVYGLTDELPVTESEKPKPITTYDLHKLLAEEQLATATQSNIIKSTSLRLSNVYGPSQGKSSSLDRGIFNKIAKMAFMGKDISVYGDGNYIRDYIYIDDVVSAIIKVAITENIEGMSLNVVSGVGVKIKEAFSMVADEVSRVTGIRVNVKEAPWPENTSSIEYRNFIGSNNQICNVTGWEPKYMLKNGLGELVKFVREGDS